MLILLSSIQLPGLGGVVLGTTATSVAFDRDSAFSLVPGEGEGEGEGEGKGHGGGNFRVLCSVAVDGGALQPAQAAVQRGRREPAPSADGGARTR